jgi:hypothetical protein
MSSVGVNHEVQTLSPTFNMIFSKSFPLTGGEKFDIYMGYGNTLIPMLTGGSISTFNRNLTKDGVEFMVNGRGPLSKVLDEAPELDQIYVPTWDRSSLNDRGEWVTSACGMKRVQPVPLGIDPKQDISEYTIISADWTVHSLLKHIIETQLKLSVILNIPDFKYREVFKILRTQTWFSAIQQLISVWEPLMFMRGNVIYILDTDISLPESSNMKYDTDSCVIATLNYSKNDIINRIIIKGGVDESITEPEKKDTWIQQIDYMTEIFGDDLSAFANDIVSSEHPTPGSGTGGFTGERVIHSYFKPMFGDPLLIATKKVQYYKNNVIGFNIEKNYYRSSGTYGPDQSVCTNVYKTRIQSWVPKGAFTKEINPSWYTGDVYIEKGFVGNTITDAADPTTSIGDLPYIWGVSFIKVYDAEKMSDSATAQFSVSTSVSREFGILPKNRVISSSVIGLTGTDTRYYLLGGARLNTFEDMYNWQKKGYVLSYRIITEQVTQVDAKSSIAIKKDSTFDYTKMTSDYDSPEVYTNTEQIPMNQSTTASNKKKPLYQYEEYFENGDSIEKYGYRPVVTYYDPSIINYEQGQRLANKIFAKSGRIEEDLSIQPTIGNPLLNIGKSIILESAAYKQINFALLSYENVTISGGNFIVNGVRHSYTNDDGFKTDIALRKLWKLY